MAMPEAAMYENDLSPRTEDQIRTAREPTGVKAVSIAKRMDKTTHAHLWLGVLASNAAHPLASLLGRKRVHDFHRSMTFIDSGSRSLNAHQLRAAFAAARNSMPVANSSAFNDDWSSDSTEEFRFPPRAAAIAVFASANLG